MTESNIQTQITCPNCHTEFSLADSIRKSLIEDERQKLYLDVKNEKKQFKEDLLREHNRKLENSAQENKDLSTKLTSLTTILEKTQSEKVNLLNQQKEAEKNRELEVAKISRKIL